MNWLFCFAAAWPPPRRQLLRPFRGYAYTSIVFRCDANFGHRFVHDVDARQKRCTNYLWRESNPVCTFGDRISHHLKTLSHKREIAVGRGLASIVTREGRGNVS